MARFFCRNLLYGISIWATLTMLRFAFGLRLLDHSFRQAMKAHKAMRRYREKSGNHYLSRKMTIDFFLQQELLPITNYLADIETIKKNRVRVFMALGKDLYVRGDFTHRRHKFWRRAQVRAGDFPRPPWFFYRYARRICRHTAQRFSQSTRS